MKLSITTTDEQDAALARYAAESKSEVPPEQFATNFFLALSDAKVEGYKQFDLDAVKQQLQAAINAISPADMQQVIAILEKYSQNRT